MTKQEHLQENIIPKLELLFSKMRKGTKYKVPNYDLAWEDASIASMIESCNLEKWEQRRINNKLFREWLIACNYIWDQVKDNK